MIYTHNHARIDPNQGSKSIGGRDVKKEHTLQKCEANGVIPEWLEGTIYKQSGGAIVGEFDPLDGLAHIVAFKIENGQVFFTNKYMRTRDYYKFVNLGKRGWGSTQAGFEKQSMLSKFAEKISLVCSKAVVPSSVIKYKQANPNVNVWSLNNGKTLGAATEAEGTICVFDSETLETLPSLKTVKSTGSRRGMVVTTPAHYFYEREDETSGGYHVALELDVKLKFPPVLKFKYTIFHGDSAPLKPVHSIDVGSFSYANRAKQSIENRPAYQHSVGCSKNYFIMLLSSARLMYEKLLAGDFSLGFFGLFKNCDVPIEFVVLKKTGSEEAPGLEYVGNIKSEISGMAWHVSNCFEDSDGNIVLDVACASELSMDAKSMLTRFVINLKENTAKDTRLRYGKEEHDFPNINPHYLMRPYKYSYCLVEGFTEASCIAKVAVEGKQVEDKRIAEEPYLMASEPVFIPNPDGTDEDDGVVLNIVLDTEEEKSYLYIINAKTMQVMSKVLAPMVCNYGLHSVFVPKDGFAKVQKL